jgi:hypothetical protein
MCGKKNSKEKGKNSDQKDGWDGDGRGEKGALVLGTNIMSSPLIPK